jgi:PAS domain S-box-containing protein
MDRVILYLKKIELLMAIMIEGREAVVVADGSGQIVMMSPAAEDMFCVRRHEILGKPLAVLMPARYQPLHKMSFVKTTENEPREHDRIYQGHGVLPDGAEFEIEIAISDVTLQGRRYFMAIIRHLQDGFENAYPPGGLYP